MGGDVVNRQTAAWLKANWPAEWTEHPTITGYHELIVDGTLVAWVHKRPSYCDRGHWQGGIEFSPGNPIDAADGLPMYYMRLNIAKQELEEKLLWRVCRVRSIGENDNG